MAPVAEEEENEIWCHVVWYKQSEWNFVLMTRILWNLIFFSLNGKQNLWVKADVQSYHKNFFSGDII